MFKIYILLLTSAAAFKMSDLKINTQDPALQTPMAKKLIEEVVATELKKKMPDLLRAIREEKGVKNTKKPRSQTLEVEMRTTDGEDELDVVVVSVWPDGTTTRDRVPSSF